MKPLFRKWPHNITYSRYSEFFMARGGPSAYQLGKHRSYTVTT